MSAAMINERAQLASEEAAEYIVEIAGLGNNDLIITAYQMAVITLAAFMDSENLPAHEALDASIGFTLERMAADRQTSPAYWRRKNIIRALKEVQ